MANNVRFSLVLQYLKASDSARTIEVRAILLGPQDKIGNVRVTFYVNDRPVLGEYVTVSDGAVSMHYALGSDEKDFPEFSAVAHVPDFGDVKSVKEKPTVLRGLSFIPAIHLEQVRVSPGHNRYFIALKDKDTRFTVAQSGTFLTAMLSHQITTQQFLPIASTPKLVKDVLVLDISKGYLVIDLINEKSGTLEIDFMLPGYPEAHQEVILQGPKTKPIEVGEDDNSAEIDLYAGVL